MKEGKAGNGLIQERAMKGNGFDTWLKLLYNALIKEKSQRKVLRDANPVLSPFSFLAQSYIKSYLIFPLLGTYMTSISKEKIWQTKELALDKCKEITLGK